MDKRILKTKKALKSALIDLLTEQNFESIRTTAICEKAMVSRNTFYNYYSDKYELLEDCFKDYQKAFQKRFDEKQEANNPEGEVRQGFMNLADAFCDLDEKFSAIPLLSSFDLMELYYRSMMEILQQYEDKYAWIVNPGYNLRQFNAFLVLGFWGYIHADPKLDMNTVRHQAKKLVNDLLNSPVFRVDPDTQAANRNLTVQ